MAITMLAGLGIGMLFGGAFGSLTGMPFGNPDKDPTAADQSASQAAAPHGGFSLLPHLDQPMSLLVLACDNTDKEISSGRRVIGMRGNTDSMILVRFDPSDHEIRALAIPRDTRVPIPGHGIFKINSANPYGGPNLSMQVVSSFLGTPVDKYMLINTRAVIQIVDALGGVDMYVPKRLYYNDWSGHLHINLHKGMNHLTGQEAHDFLRFRHDELGDIGRVERQQMFFQALMKEFMTPANLLKVPQLLAVAHDNTETNLSADELFKIVGWGKDLSRHDVQMSMVPGSAQTIDGVSYWVADDQATRRTVDQFLLHTTPAEARAPHDYRVAIRDGVGDYVASHALRRALVEAGYGEVAMDGYAAEMGQDQTEIIAQNADIAGAKALAQTLGVGKVVVAATGNIYTDFTVVVGKDWVGRVASAR
ncbi:MAG TPA: LCP family protein [Oscillatoriaceae cyanobacterium]